MVIHLELHQMRQRRDGVLPDNDHLPRTMLCSSTGVPLR